MINVCKQYKVRIVIPVVVGSSPISHPKFPFKINDLHGLTPSGANLGLISGFCPVCVELHPNLTQDLHPILTHPI